MDYIGSKEKINEWMFSIMLRDKKADGLIFLDACAGSGSVSKYAAQYDFGKIISNDIMEFPAHIIRASISFPNSKLETAIQLINEMNELDGYEGFFFRHYSEKAGRLYFSNENAKKIDACRIFIEKQTQNEPYLKSYLLYCLLEALSAVSNTAGVQAAFLKKLKDRAQKPLRINYQNSLYKFRLVKTFNRDILSLLTSNELREDYQEDILYIDPPYNERQYAPNYHLYETLVKYDDPFVHGKTGLRDWQREAKSDFCSKKTCLSLTKNIVAKTTAKDIYISYNSDGILTLDDFKSIADIVQIFEIEQKRFKSDADPSKTYNTKPLKEYLIHIRKQVS